MKKILVGGGVVLILLTTSCSDETTMTPGDPADPAFDALTLGFGDVEQSTRQMTGMTFEILGGILDGGSPPAKPGFQALDYNLHYDEATEFWVARLIFDDTEGNYVTVVDSVQFLQGGEPRQFPNPDSLEAARSFLTVEASGPEGTLGGFQNLTLDRSLEDSTVTVNGNGGLAGSFTSTREDSAGVTNCAVDATFTCAIDQLVADLRETPAGACPLSGRTTHRGRLAVACAGAHPLSHEGSWTVVTTFAGGDSAQVHATSGDNYWDFTAACGD